MPVNRLLVSMSLPLMTSMLVLSLYNIVDSYFVLYINESALTAVLISYAIQNSMTAVATGTAVGVNALLSRYLGDKDYDKLRRIEGTAIVLMLFSFLLFFFFGVFFTDMFFRSQTDIPEIINCGNQYLRIVCCGSLGMFLQSTFERMLQASGKTVYAMITQITGAVINLILDPILIFGYFGFTKMGIAGAAVATITGQTVAGIMALIINQKVNKEIHVYHKDIYLDIAMTKEIYQIGIPTMIMQMIVSITNYFMNYILMGIVSTASVVYGICYKLSSFFFLPILGLGSGIIPVMAYNYGAKKRSRVKETMKFGIRFAITISLIGTLVFMAFPKFLFGIFNSTPALLEIGVLAMRIISLSFVVAGLSISTSCAYQALGKAKYSMYVSITRQLVVLIPIAYLLSRTGNINYVWFAIPISDISSFILTMIFYRKVNKTVINHIDDKTV